MTWDPRSRFLILLSRLKEPGRARAAAAAALYAGVSLLMFFGLHFPKGGGHPTGTRPLLISTWNAVFSGLSYPGDWFMQHNALLWIWLAWIGAYAFLVHAVARLPIRRFAPLAAVAVVAALPLLVTPFLQTVDPWEYLIRARILVVYGNNPYVTLPNSIPNDPLFRMTYWHGVNFVYGPIWLALMSALVMLPGIQLLQITLLKAGTLALQVGSAWALWEIRRESPAEVRARDVALLLFSPMMMFESAANGHADFAMIFLLLLGVLLDRRGLATLAATSLAGAVLVKAYAAIVLGCYAFALARRFRGPRLWIDLSRVLAPAAIAVVLTYSPFYDGMRLIPNVRGGGAESSVVNSLGRALLIWFRPGTVIHLGLAATALVTAGSFAHSWRTGRWVTAAAVGTFLWCTVGATWFMAWYACFVLALALCTENMALRDAALLLSVLTFSFYVRETSGWPFQAWRIDGQLANFVPGWPLMTFVIMALRFRRRSVGAPD